jgi:N-acetylneuraminate synthase
LRAIRPGNGIAPKFYDEVIGKTAKRDIARGTPLAHDLIA